MLIGVAWFLKLAFDRNWIGPPVRVWIGLACAAGLMVWSERFRRRGFPAFAYSLKALGTSIAYLSLWAASSIFHLAPSGLIFLAMTAVTVANAVLARRQDSEVLGLYALAGGLATPGLLSMGHSNEIFLFSYLALLNVGALVLLALHPWKRLAWAALLGTAVLLHWPGAVSENDPSHLPVTVFFLALFFAGFAARAFDSARSKTAADSSSDHISNCQCRGDVGCADGAFRSQKPACRAPLGHGCPRRRLPADGEPPRAGRRLFPAPTSVWASFLLPWPCRSNSMARW